MHPLQSMRIYGDYEGQYVHHSKMFKWIRSALHVGNFRANPSMKPVAVRAYGEFMFYFGQLSERCKSIDSRSHNKKKFYGLWDKVSTLQRDWSKVMTYIDDMH